MKRRNVFCESAIVFFNLEFFENGFTAARHFFGHAALFFFVETDGSRFQFTTAVELFHTHA